MKRLQNASIRSKIMLLLLVILALQILVAAVGSFYLNQTNRTLQSIIDVETENIALANEINLALEDKPKTLGGPTSELLSKFKNK